MSVGQGLQTCAGEDLDMNIHHMIKKSVREIRSEGFWHTLREIAYSNRVMVAVEKDIKMTASLLPERMTAIVVDQTNYGTYRKAYDIGSVLSYCKRGAQALMVFEGFRLMGYQLWTRNKDFVDLRKLDIALEDNAAYLFDLFVLPEFRGTVVPKIVATETFNYLASRRIEKIYGFYYKDNIKALWWHRAYLRCREIREVPTRRYFILERTRGRWSLKI